ncbi:MAG TPA: CPBP family intramembrane glutamic endopeptidase [Trinickia sp.]
MNSKRIGYCFPNLLEAFFIVIALYFLELLTNSLIWHLGIRSGLKPVAIEDLGRVLAYGVGFAVLLECNSLTYRGLVEGDRFSWQATLSLFLLPMLLFAPGMLAVENLLQVLVLKFFPLSETQRMAGYRFLTDGLSSMVLVSFLAPVIEELLFRGIILRSFLRQYSRSRAIVYSAVVFGFAHMNIHQFVTAFTLGFVIGEMYERTRSLLPGMLLHAFYNAAVTAAAFRCGPDATALCGSWGMPQAWYPVSLASGAIGLCLLFKLLGMKAVVPFRGR